MQETFERRKDRFLALNKEKLLFIRAVNGTEELNHIGNLYRALKERFPKSQVLLLVFIDLQNCPREVIVQDLGPSVIFSSVHHSSWGPLTAHHTRWTSTGNAWGSARSSTLWGSSAPSPFGAIVVESPFGHL